MRNLPSGTVTFLFTDIEGSTRLLEQLGAEYEGVLAEHRRLIREAVTAHEGVEVDMQGDAFLVAFQRATDAVAAAADAQRALQQTPVRVRMGIHTGEPTRTEEGYVGVDLHRGARVVAAGHGGQVLLSQVTRDLCADFRVRDLGEHRLKDLSEPQRLYQLLGEDLESDFPPPKTLENRPTNLPVQPTPLVGREQELRELLELLGREQVRLVTLTGPGGTGKTRLALQAAAELVEAYPDGVWFVNLAALTDPELVLPTIAQTLAIKEQPGEAIFETVAQRLREQRTLLVLDNFEQVLAAAPVVARLLQAAPQLNVIVTSRSPLRLQAEQEYPVPHLAEAEAVALFAERAQAAKPSFSLNGNRPVVAEICRRLDQLPLAIELAAARIKLLPESALLERLSDRLKLLTGGPRDVEARQRTLRAAIDWSYELLSEEEQIVLRRLAIFAGGCTFDAAEAVCNLDGAVDAFDGIASLVEKSLLRQEEAEGEPRFVMLETIHEYTREKLEASGEADALRTRHAQYFLELADALFDEFAEARDSHGFVRFEDEQDNFRAAISTLHERGGTEALQLARRLWLSWLTRGQLHEGERAVDLALKAGHDAPAPLRAWMLGVLGEFPRFRGEHKRAIELKQEALQASRTLGMDRVTTALLCDIAESLEFLGDRERAHELLDEALELEERSQDPRRTRARAAAAELAMARHDYDDALCRYEEILEILRPFRREETTAYVWVLSSHGECLRRLGDRAGSAMRFREAITLAMEFRILTWLPDVLQGLAHIAAAEAPYRSAVLLGASTAVCAETGLAGDSIADEAVKEAVRQQLQTATFDLAMTEGSAKSVDEAAAYALATLEALRFSNG